MTKTKKLISILILFAITTLTFILGFSFLNAKAFTGRGNLSEKELYNATNTYHTYDYLFDTDESFIPANYPIIGDPNPPQYKIRYDMSSKVNKPIMDTTQITVLTHGLGAKAGTWSNNYSKNQLNDAFEYSPDSLITKIDEKVGGAQIYKAEMNGYKDFTLSELEVVSNNKKEVYFDSEIPSITDVSKHIIVVFEAYNSNESNDNVYYQFNYMLSKIIYDVSLCNPDQKLPKVNLVGHSRGGLTNLQYALDHPDLVSTMVSIGTPYFGSTSANVFGEIIVGASDGLSDIIDAETYFEYNNRWNDNYEELYKNIKVHTISSYQSIASLIVSLGIDYSGQIDDGAQLAAQVAFGIIGALKQVLYGNTLQSQILVKVVFQMLNTLLPNSGTLDLAELILSEIYYDRNTARVIWENDVLVPLDSQRGVSLGSIQYGGGTYKGFTNYTRFYGMSYIKSNPTKVSSAHLPIAHNLEARDSVVIAEVLRHIELDGTTQTSYRYFDNDDGENTVTFAGYDGIINENIFTVPSTILGKTVTQIGDNAFEGQSAIEEIILSDNIRKIGDNAFAGLTKLTSVQTSSAFTPLEEIGNGAFAGCTSLSMFYNSTSGRLFVPTEVTKIGDFAFYNTGFDNIKLGGKINHIGEGAFSNIANLTAIDFYASNSKYCSINGVLYEKGANGTLIQYPIAKNDTSFEIPTAITVDSQSIPVNKVGNYAFSGATYLTSVNLNGLSTVDTFGFADCTNLATISNTQNVQDASYLSFVGTQVDMTSEFVVIGNVLVKYNGTATNLKATDFPQGVTTIGAFAFSENTTLESIELPASISKIEDSAFIACTALSSVFDTDTTLPTINSLPFVDVADGFKFYCRKALLDGLTSEDAWYFEKSKAPISTTVTFVTNKNGGEVGDSELDIRTFYYGEEVDVTDQLVPEWYIPSWHRVDDTTGEMSQEQLSSTLIWNELVTSATYKAEIIQLDTYTLRFVNGEELIAELVVNREETFDFNTTSLTIDGQTTNVPTLQNCSYKDYYGVSVLNGVTLATFTGWMLEGKAISTSPDEGWNTYHCFPVLEVKSLWTPTVFNATLDSGFNYVEHVSFNYFDGYELDQVDFVTEHYFLGWYDTSGIKYENLAGVYESIALTARWEEYVYRVTLSSHGYMDGATEYRFGASGATFILPQWETTTGIVVGWLDDMDREIPVGTEYEIYTTVTLEAIWEGKWFDVNYSNITFMGQTAGVFIEGGSDAPLQYQHGEGLNLLETYAHFDVFEAYEPRLVFLGWYTDMTFTTIVDQIFINQSGAVNVYAKWRYDFGYGSRSGGTRTVTSDGQLTQVADNIYIGLNTTGLVDELIRIGITKLHIKYKINMWEVVDGSQYIYFYGGADGKTLLTSKTLNVGTTHRVQVINVEFDLEDLGVIGTVYVRYKASQSTFLFWTTSHDWQNDHIYFEVCYVAQSGDETAEEFTWDYMDTLA